MPFVPVKLLLALIETLGGWEGVDGHFSGDEDSLEWLLKCFVLFRLISADDAGSSCLDWTVVIC